MMQRDLETLNSLVTFAAENIPGGLNTDEQAVARMVGIWCLDGIPVAQVCPHCHTPAPYGPDRMLWLEKHVDSALHRNWWYTKNLIQEFRDRFKR